MRLVAVMVGGAVGALARWAIEQIADILEDLGYRRFSSAMPSGKAARLRPIQPHRPSRPVGDLLSGSDAPVVGPSG